jgi:hypothetical protein
MASRARIEAEIVAVALGGPRDLPVDLYQIARDIQVSAIRTTNFRAGFTDFSSAVPVIYLNDVQLETTKRFVLAHELAHVILRLPDVLRLICERGRADLFSDEEALADRIAGTILLPDVLIEPLRSGCYPLKHLKYIARLANISVMVLVARMVWSDIDIALLHWRRGDDAWHVIDRPCAPPSLHGYIKPSISGHRVIENLSNDESEILVDCHVSGRRVEIAGRGYRNKQHAFQFLAPSVGVRFTPEMNSSGFNDQTFAPSVHYRPSSGRHVWEMSDVTSNFAPRPV